LITPYKLVAAVQVAPLDLTQTAVMAVHHSLAQSLAQAAVVERVVVTALLH
jgi:hypothetical protein